MSPERPAMLGDAVFAIAITLPALDITVPEGLQESEVPHSAPCTGRRHRPRWRSSSREPARVG
ncbi:hypothetical protein [Streptomyces sp. NPDC001714]|uniref:hypothetical protein n=1 Tax=Streptomyces sp. NPDC001714 TaxID=3364603 RepID=UPI003687C468